MRRARTAIYALSWIPVAITVQQTCGQLFWVYGSSMQPSLNPDSSLGYKDLLVVQKFGLKKPDSFKRGDVVVLRSPSDPARIVVKRVTAVQGDVVENPRNTFPRKNVKIPTSHLWVEGDNIHSVDSNIYGPVSSGLVVGKARYIVWPPSRWGLIPERQLD